MRAAVVYFHQIKEGEPAMNLCDRKEIQTLLERHGFRFSKALGQNFLIEDWVPRDIAEASGADEHTGVLEIGPGIGPLTQELAKQAGRVASVELDRRLYPVLAETMAGFDNFTLIPGDVMDMDLPSLVAEQFSGLRPILCANLPYNITTPVLTKCVESRCFDSLTVLIQKEVAQRICAAPGTADYGAFTLLMQYYTAPELLFTVPNTCFLPAPKVTSAVIHCPVRKSPPVEITSEAALWRTVRAGFALRRKTLVNSLQTGYDLPRERLAEIVTACGLEPTVRGERLGLADYARLANALAGETQHT
jgi:16S rRNA (adenine1518-N6/adenine1519-N6)-dimethyltransferase